MLYTLYWAQDKTFRSSDCTDETEFDVFNCLSIMENTSFLQELKFGAGDGTLHFYMFNYMLKAPGYLDGTKIATVLV